MLVGEARELVKRTVTTMKKSHRESAVRYPEIDYGYFGRPNQEYCQATETLW
jgi:hypothetical protein